jgi:hypothetical protein
MTYLLLILTLPLVKAETPNWYCKEVASERSGNIIHSCGIGTGQDENEARSTAFDNAKTEFKKICNLSSDCKNHMISVNPERTTCDKIETGYKCHRLLTFSIGPIGDKFEIEQDEKVSNTRSVSSLKYKPVDNIKSPDTDEIFKPFVYSQIDRNPKVYVGMSKKDLLQKFGIPYYVSFGPELVSFQFKGKMCDNNSYCYVTLQDNYVKNYIDFKSIYTDLLK